MENEIYMVKFCPECGNPLASETSKFCDKCGAKFPFTSPDVGSLESQPAHSRWDVPPVSSDPSTIQTPAPQPQGPTIQTPAKKRSMGEWYIIIGGGIILLIFLSAFVAGMFSGISRDNYQYCSANYPGTIYDPTTKMCEHIVTQTPYPTPTPAQQTNTISENDRLFASTSINYLTEFVFETEQLQKAAYSHDTKALSYWSSKLSSTCSDAINKLSPISVSPGLQSGKDEFLSSLSDYKKAGDKIVIGVNYIDNGQTTLGNGALEEAIAYMSSGQVKIERANRLIRNFIDKSQS
jgi:hypothetical protein